MTRLISQLGCMLLFIIGAAWSLDCNMAPSPVLHIICMQLQRWDNGARMSPLAKDILPPAIAGEQQMAADFAPMTSTAHQCMTIQCLCNFFRGDGGNYCVVQGRPLGKAYRKEYRMLSDNERNRLHAAFRTLKANGEYDRIARVHAQFASSGGAHSGPAFLPWHREFMKRVEIALREVDPSLALPYWDSTLDQNLPDSRDSIIWTNEFMGESDRSGYVVNGPFRNWRTLENRPNIRRAVGGQGSLMTEAEVAFTLNQRDVHQVLAFSAPRPNCPYRPNFNVLEYTHGNPHIYVGGDMKDQSTAANDPIFFLHHSFVDMVWELWRQRAQTRYSRENDYPRDNAQCSSQHHFRNSFMRPFPPLRNSDGLSNMYTDNMYSYAPRPNCNMGANCGSRYLFCDRSHGAPRCAAMIKPGGNCSPYRNGENMCHNGYCRSGRCVSGRSQATPPPPINTVRPVIQAQETCFNEHQCCAHWSSIGECRRNPNYMNEWCRASCNKCRPRYDLRIECQDRHPNCASWSRLGECTKNPLWMAENCRRSCNKCGTTRLAACGAQARKAQPTTPARSSIWHSASESEGCTTPTCFNENICCAIWAGQGRCRTNADYMNCECKVSCNRCRPGHRQGICADYHKDCVNWSRTGECQKNEWMLENCRRSCNSCRSTRDLQRLCSNRRARTAEFIAYETGM